MAHFVLAGVTTFAVAVGACSQASSHSTPGDDAMILVTTDARMLVSRISSRESYMVDGTKASSAQRPYVPKTELGKALFAARAKIRSGGSVLKPAAVLMQELAAARR